MKIHFGSTKFPWHLMAKLPSVYRGDIEYTTHQIGHVRRVFGVSFGLSRFIGVILTGPFVHEEGRILTKQESATAPTPRE